MTSISVAHQSSEPERMKVFVILVYQTGLKGEDGINKAKTVLPPMEYFLDIGRIGLLRLPLAAPAGRHYLSSISFALSQIYYNFVTELKPDTNAKYL